MLYLPLPEFVRSLCILDEDGRSLNFLPNEIVKEVVAELQQSDPQGHAVFVHRFKQDQYTLAVLLPTDNPFRPGSVRTVRLRYQAHAPVKNYPLFGKLPKMKTGTPIRRRVFRQWTSRIFSIPFIEITTTRFPGHDYDHFFVVEGTPDLTAWATDSIEGTEPSKQIYRNGFDDNSRVLSVRLPPADKGHYRWKMIYEQRPVSASRLVILSSYLVGMLASVVLGWVAFTTQDVLHLASPAVEGGLVTGMLGVMLTLDKPWEDRYRLLLVFPLVAEAALLAATLSR